MPNGLHGKGGFGRIVAFANLNKSGKEMKMKSTKANWSLGGGKLRLASLAAAAVLAAHAVPEQVKVSDFGFDAADSTAYIQAALTSGARRVTLDKQAGPWVTLPLKMRSNTELILEPGVELLAKRGEYKGLRDYLLELPYCTNVTIRGGAGSTLRMWKKDYQGPDYKHGEWRYALRIFHCRNVLVEGLTIVESGGDGIGVTGCDITIRNCVCDRNHRQGMSVFNVKNFLVENCVFSNTSGTPPQAGVDIEPDHSNERLENIVFRNCQSFGNAGAGFEAYLAQLRKSSGPVSIRFENCRTWGNNGYDAGLVCTKKLDEEPVDGVLCFENCVFGPSRRGGVSLSSIPAKAMDVVFRNTTISNAPGTVAVNVSVVDPSQGRPDGIDFGNLTVCCDSATNRWFKCSGMGTGDVKAVRGNVRLLGADGTSGSMAIDDAWVAANIPVFGNGMPIPPRRDAPDVSAVEILDEAPGELVDTAPITILSRTPIVFFAERPGPCRFVCRQIIAVKGLKPTANPVLIAPIKAKKDRGKAFSVPSTDPVEIVFKAPKRGFYRITPPKGRIRFRIDKTSVPLAIATTESQARVAPIGGKPFSLSFWAESAPWVFCAHGSDYYRFKVAVTDATGADCGSSGEVFNTFIANGEGKTGFCTVTFGKAAKPNYDHIGVNLFGARGFLFISDRKRWR